MTGPTSPTSDRRDRRGGFTLIELMIALAIMALIAALALPRVFPSGGATASRATAYAIASVLRGDRTTALRTGQPVTTRVDERAGMVSAGSSTVTVTVPRDTELATRAIEDAAVTFRPDGSSTGGAIVLKRDDTAYTVLVAPLTAGVQIVTGEP
jgi:general secretion pathway protein H